MNSTVQVGRVCFDPIYFPPREDRRGTLFFMLEVAMFIRPNKRVIDYFNVQYTGNQIEAVARKLRRAQFVCVRGAVHLDKERVCMRIRADQHGGVEIYTRLPPSPPEDNPRSALFSSNAGDMFLRSVEACRPGDYLVLGNPIRVVQGKKKQSNHPQDDETEMPENLPQWMDSMNDVIVSANPFNGPDTPILPDFSAFMESEASDSLEGEEGVDEACTAPQGHPSEVDDDDPEETQNKDACPPIPHRNVTTIQRVTPQLTPSNPFPSPVSALSPFKIANMLESIKQNNPK